MNRAPRSLGIFALLFALACTGGDQGAPAPSSAATGEAPSDRSSPNEGPSRHATAGTAAIAATGTPTPGAEAPAARTQPTSSQPPVVVFLGDSLSAGFGLAAEQAFPSLVAAELAARGVPIRAVNAGVSGDTSAGGRRRLAWLLRQRPAVVVVELGGNDGLRGQPVGAIEANLRQIVTQATAAGSRVLLAGMRVPPSYGDQYAEEFAAIYPRLAVELDVPLLPFLLEGVAGDPELNLADGIHPNAEGHRLVAALVAGHLEPLLRQSRPAATAAR